MKYRKYIAALLAAFLALSFNFEEGDLRYSIANLTFRHWNLVNDVEIWKPACALVRSGGYPCGAGGATTYTFVGPTGSKINVVTSNYSVAGNGASTVTITPSDTSHGGFFTPSTVNLANTNQVSFTYTPLQIGTFNLSTTNSGSLTNPSPISFTTVASNVTGYPNFSTWATSNATQTGTQTDPFGGTNAISLVENTANGYHQDVSPSFTFVVNQTYLASIMLKQDGGSARRVGFWVGANDSSAAFDVTIDPSSCTVANTSTWGGVNVSATNTATKGLGSGWCLGQVTFTVPFTSGFMQLFLDNGTTEIYTGDNTSGLFFYGAAVE